MSKKRVVIIGGGIGGLGTACLFAKSGHHVTLLEKNGNLGGRANVFEQDGFRFDMGPSWYLAPDLFEHFFNLVGERVEDHLDLKRLSPSYRIFFANGGGKLDIHSDIDKDSATFEAIQPGAGEKLRAYLRQAKKQYEAVRENFIYRNWESFRDLFDWRFLSAGRELSVFSSMHRFVSRYFSSPKLRKVMEYTMVFLGTSPYQAPAIYSLLSHLDLDQGVFYPRGGFYELIKSLARIAAKNGADLRTGAEVEQILTYEGKAVGVRLKDGTMIDADVVVSNADMWFTETRLLEPESQSYPEAYWQKRVVAPSALIIYLGVGEKLAGLAHHNLIFSEDWQENFDEIYKRPRLPRAPSLYVCAPSVTDTTVAPEGKENLFVLVPIAPGIKLTDESTEEYANKVLALIEDELGLAGLREKIEFRRLYSIRDFQHDYNAFKGTALGLAHTLRQTAIFRPNNRSKKVSNLFHVGAGTNPGIGTQICLISSELVYKRILGIKESRPLERLKVEPLQNEKPKDQEPRDRIDQRKSPVNGKDVAVLPQ